MRSIPLPILFSFSIAFLLRSALRTYYFPTACHRHGPGKPGCLHKLILLRVKMVIDSGQGSHNLLPVRIQIITHGIQIAVEIPKL